MMDRPSAFPHLQTSQLNAWAGQMVHAIPFWGHLRGCHYEPVDPLLESEQFCWEQKLAALILDSD